MSGRALVANDQQLIVRLVEVNLQRAGYEVLTAFDQEATVDMARTLQPSLVVLDAEWSDVAKRLKADPLAAGIRVVVVSGQNIVRIKWGVA